MYEPTVAATACTRHTEAQETYDPAWRGKEVIKPYAEVKIYN